MTASLPPGLIAGRAVVASVQSHVSPELARHHIDVHPCPKTAPPVEQWYRCEHDHTMVSVWKCGACEEPLAVVAEESCEHLPRLLQCVDAEAEARW